MFHEELVGGEEGDGLPGVFVEEAVGLTGGDLEVDGDVAEGLPFGVSDVPAFFPGILIAEEGDGGCGVFFEVAEDVDFGVLVVVGSEGGVEPEVGDDGGVDVFGVGRVVEAGVEGSEGADVTAGGAATGDDALGVDAEFGGVLFEPADGAFGVGDADAFAGFTGWEFGAVGFAEHLVFGGGADEAA